MKEITKIYRALFLLSRSWRCRRNPWVLLFVWNKTYLKFDYIFLFHMCSSSFSLWCVVSSLRQHKKSYFFPPCCSIFETSRNDLFTGMKTCIEHIKHLNIAQYPPCKLTEVIGLRKLCYGLILFLHHSIFHILYCQLFSKLLFII